MTNAKALTLALITKAYKSGHAAYEKRNDGKAGKFAKNGLQSDVARGLAHWEAFSAGQWEAVKALGIDATLIEGIAATGNVKVLLRLPALIEFCVSGNVKALTGSAKTAVAELLALEAGAKNRSALAYAATGKGDQFTSDGIDVDRVRLFTRALGLGKVGVSTEQTQNSVTFAKGNLCAMLGAASKDSRKGMPVLNRDAGIVRAIFAHVNKASERDLIALANEHENK